MATDQSSTTKLATSDSGSPVSTPPVRPAERYGDLRPAWHSTLARVLVVTLAVLGLAWLVWAGLGVARQDVRYSDIGYNVVDATRAEATFDVTVYTGTTATCTVQALAEDYAVVGSQQVQITVPEPGNTVRERVEVLTQQRAVTAIVGGCTVP